MRRRAVCIALGLGPGLAALIPGSASATPATMSVDDIVKIAVTIPGFSYFWGGSAWSPGATDKGVCTPTATDGCPSCTHTGAWGADCSGFLAKAWQIPAPIGLDVVSHPYSTQNFVNDTTWWTPISRDVVVKGDALGHYDNGAGHIFLFEKGDAWGDMWAWECKGCAYGCTYDLRSATSNYIAVRRKMLAVSSTCTAGCEGTKLVNADCSSSDCAASSANCLSDALGLRCVSPLCPTTGGVVICLADGTNGKCDDGVLSALGTPCAATAPDAGASDEAAAETLGAVDAKPDAVAGAAAPRAASGCTAGRGDGVAAGVAALFALALVRARRRSRG